MKFFEKFKQPFAKKPETEKNPSSIVKTIGAISNVIRKGVSSVFKHSVKTSIAAGGVLAAAAPAVAAEVPSDEAAFNQFFQIDPIVAVTDAEPQASEPTILSNDGEPVQTNMKELIAEKNTPNTIINHESEIKVEPLPDSPFAAFVAGSLVEHDGEFYNVVRANTKVITLKNINTAEGAPNVFLKAVDNPNLKPAYIQDVYNDFKTFKAERGMNATDIAQGLGLRGWIPGTIFNHKTGEIYTDDKKIPANTELAALEDPAKVKEVVGEFQNYLNQFVTGEVYILKKVGAEPVRIIIQEVKNGMLIYCQDLDAGIKLSENHFEIEPQQWKDVESIIPEPEISIDQESSEEGAMIENSDQENVIVQADSDEEEDKSTPDDDSEFKGEGIEMVAQKTIEKPAGDLQTILQEIYEKQYGDKLNNQEHYKLSPENLIAYVFQNFPEVATGIVRGHFSKIDYTKELSDQDKYKVIILTKKLLARTEKMAASMQTMPELDKKLIETTQGIFTKKSLLSLVLSSETSGSMEHSYVPSDGGKSWGPFNVMESFIKYGFQNCQKLIGKTSATFKELKIDKLEEQYKIYRQVVTGVEKSNFPDKAKKQMLENSKVSYVKAVLKIDSPIFSNPGVIADLVMANAINTFEKINDIEVKFAKRGVIMSAEDKKMAYYFGYHFGIGKLMKASGNDNSKPGILVRFMVAKSQNPELQMMDWLQQIGYKDDTVNYLTRKKAFCELQQKVQESEIKFAQTKKVKEFDEFYAQNANDFKTLHGILKSSKLSEKSTKGMLKLFMNKIQANPKLSCADVLDGLIKTWERKNALEGSHESLVQGLKNIKVKFTEISKVKAAKNLETAEVQTINAQPEVPGGTTFASVAQKMRDRFGDVMDGVVEFGDSINPLNLQQQPAYARTA